MQTVKVIYRKHKGEILALFPELPGTNNPSTCQCYAHIGQHGSADYNFVISGSKPAKPEEYAGLHKELSSIYESGFPDIACKLDIKKKATYQDYVKRKRAIT